MRRITVPASAIARIVNGPIRGRSLITVVDLGWPELRLTESQIIENAVAHAWGQPAPHIDRNLVEIELPWVIGSATQPSPTHSDERTGAQRQDHP